MLQSLYHAMQDAFSDVSASLQKASAFISRKTKSNSTTAELDTPYDFSDNSKQADSTGSAQRQTTSSSGNKVAS